MRKRRKRTVPFLPTGGKWRNRFQPLAVWVQNPYSWLCLAPLRPSNARSSLDLFLWPLNTIKGISPHLMYIVLLELHNVLPFAKRKKDKKLKRKWQMCFEMLRVCGSILLYGYLITWTRESQLFFFFLCTKAEERGDVLCWGWLYWCPISVWFWKAWQFLGGKAALNIIWIFFFFLEDLNCERHQQNISPSGISPFTCSPFALHGNDYLSLNTWRRRVLRPK